MKTFASLAAAAFAVVAAAPAAHAQALVTQPYQTLIVQPGTTVIRETPLLAVQARQPVEIISTVETVRTIHPAARPHVRHHVMASRKIQDRVAVNGDHPLYNMAAEPVVQTAVATPAVQTFAAPVVAPGVGPGLSGQFRCIAGCAGGLAGPSLFVDPERVGPQHRGTRSASRHGHGSIIPATSGCEAGMKARVYSADGMTIQFDNGTVWARDVILVVPPVR